MLGSRACRSFFARSPPEGSLAFGVGQPASSTVFRLLSLFPAGLFPFCAGVPAIGVGQPFSAASAGSAPPAGFGPPFAPSVARGVFQHFESDRPEEGSLADVRRADARSRNIARPNGVVCGFQSVA